MLPYKNCTVVFSNEAIEKSTLAGFFLVSLLFLIGVESDSVANAYARK